MTELKTEIVSGLLDMKQAAAYLNIKTSTLYALCIKKKIRVVKITRNNRFLKGDLDKYIESHTREAVNNEFPK